MKGENLKFLISLVALLIYELGMIVFHFNGLSIFKIILTLFVWISFCVAFLYYLRRYKVLKRSIPRLAHVTLVLLLVWNLFNIIRSIYYDVGTLTTVFGNVYTCLSLLVPFVIIFSINKFSIKNIQAYFLILLKTGLIAFFIFFIFNVGGNFNTVQIHILLLLLLPVIFLITVLPYQKKKNTLLILISMPILLYAASLYGVRTMAIRVVLLFACLIAVYLYGQVNWKWVLPLSCLVLLLPFILIQQSVATGESAITKYLSGSTDDDLSIDTRTFIYTELFADLVSNDQLLIGKGANGRYYSEYFSTQEGDSDIRLNIEVGALGLLLKGGFIAVVLNLFLLILAVFYAFFQSKNYYVIGIGFLLLVHFILLFIENIIVYSSYNYFTWFFIGICLSKPIRNLKNSEINFILNSKK